MRTGPSQWYSLAHLLVSSVITENFLILPSLLYGQNCFNKRVFSSRY